MRDGLTVIVPKYVSGTFAASGDNAILTIPAPGAGFRLAITDLTLQSESATATTMILKDSAGTVLQRFVGASNGAFINPVHGPHDFKRAGDNATLILNLSGANACGYTIGYIVEAV